MRAVWVFILSSLMLTSLSFGAEFLNGPQKMEAVTAIDNMCGDTWCEGEFDFSFNDISCDGKTKSCVVFFEIIEVNWNETITRTMATKCKVSGVDKFSDIVEYDPYLSLVYSFHLKLSDCITKEEDKFRELEGWLDNAIATK